MDKKVCYDDSFMTDVLNEMGDDELRAYLDALACDFEYEESRREGE